MSFERPGLNDDNAVSDTEVNEALEEGQLDEAGLNLDKVEHEDGERSPGPEPTDVPQDQDVTTDETGQPVEPPD
jgi:hypothetical protein